MSFSRSKKEVDSYEKDDWESASTFLSRYRTLRIIVEDRQLSSLSEGSFCRHYIVRLNSLGQSLKYRNNLYPNRLIVLESHSLNMDNGPLRDSFFSKICIKRVQLHSLDHLGSTVLSFVREFRGSVFHRTGEHIISSRSIR